MGRGVPSSSGEVERRVGGLGREVEEMGMGASCLGMGGGDPSPSEEERDSVSSVVEGSELIISLR